MDVTKLIRNPSKILEQFKEIGDTVVTTKGCKVYFPKRFEERNMAVIGARSSVCGFVGIVVDDLYYASLNVVTMIPFVQDESSIVDINGTPYYELVFRPGSVVIDNVNCLKTDTLTYAVYDLLISKGRVPWYMSYENLCNVFSTAKKYANANLGDRPEAIAMCVSLIARASDNMGVYYRQVVEEQSHVPPKWVAMKSVEYTATNTIAKLGGSYFSTGVVSSLIDPSEDKNLSMIEQILRK